VFVSRAGEPAVAFAADEGVQAWRAGKLRRVVSAGIGKGVHGVEELRPHHVRRAVELAPGLVAHIDIVAWRVVEVGDIVSAAASVGVDGVEQHCTVDVSAAEQGGLRGIGVERVVSG